MDPKGAQLARLREQIWTAAYVEIALRVSLNAGWTDEHLIDQRASTGASAVLEIYDRGKARFTTL